MRELLMWLMKKSRKVMFVNSNMKDERVSLPKTNAALEKLNEDEDDVYMTSIHDRYAARPNALEDLCLAKFAVNYELQIGRGKEGDCEKAFMMTMMMMMVMLRSVVILIVTLLFLTVSLLLNSRMALVKCKNGGKKQFCV